MKELITNLDFWGCTTSFMCAVHCAVLPVLFSIGLVGSHSILAHPLFEFVVIALTTYFVFKSIIRPYLRFKHNKRAFYIANFGLGLLAFHHMFEVYGTIIVVLGGFSIALAHLINFAHTGNSFSKSID
ncbi:MAG: MerC domain-containing protein [Bacteroidia bacterium]|nr:MerC domain-containing protein [Bacteroidia bacterium]